MKNYSAKTREFIFSFAKSIILNFPDEKLIEDEKLKEWTAGMTLDEMIDSLEYLKELHEEIKAINRKMEEQIAKK